MSCKANWSMRVVHKSIQTLKLLTKWDSSTSLLFLHSIGELRIRCILSVPGVSPSFQSRLITACLVQIRGMKPRSSSAFWLELVLLVVAQDYHTVQKRDMIRGSETNKTGERSLFCLISYLFYWQFEIDMSNFMILNRLLLGRARRQTTVW